MSEENDKAQHLDYWSRNQRLYETLLGFGLWVEPVFADSPIEGDIDYLRVSVGQPKATEAAKGSSELRPTFGDYSAN